MTHSMTAFARVQKQLDTGIFCWEIRSVNHRYLDVSFRLPDAFRFLETSLRAMLRDRLSRGKLECQLKFQDMTSDNQAMHINENLVNGLIDVGNKLSAAKHLANDLTLHAILTWPGVIQATQPDIEILGQYGEQLFGEALSQLIEVRKTEGQALQSLVQNRLLSLGSEVKNAKLYVTSNAEQARDKLLTRLRSLQLEVDSTRIEQEIALQLARLDVCEELDRLETHIVEVAKVLKNSEAAGRRLDFLMQELNREANTLSSKSDSVALTQSAVEMKVLIEQMREQIQNIE
ncbi:MULTISPECIES: YicC/YloC family endoribonuclease [Legionella]|uniref:Putative stress-induced protein n=1 Tax=Legionella drozanskii LLAP-1 TaxID=1212489 RepID=A0A0W0SRK1_9GAMM|nr:MULTISPECIES: YicC/YloC family endoribonuclease [Legionella]KTC86042.1 putative stress-induced protein [Legionella drozanskii LLAP-1]PJE10554.1 MAG: YicC family protein [Legionella sp.]